MPYRPESRPQVRQQTSSHVRPPQPARPAAIASSKHLYLRHSSASLPTACSILLVRQSHGYKMSEFQPTIAPQAIAPQNIAPQDDGSGVAPAPVPEAPEPVPITEQEVGEYREQDRFLPVRLPPPRPPSPRARPPTHARPRCPARADASGPT